MSLFRVVGLILFTSSLSVSAAQKDFPELKAPVLPQDVKSQLKDLQNELGRIVHYH